MSFVDPDSPTKIKFSAKLTGALKMEMPDDFFYFYDFCSTLSPSSITGEKI